MKISSVNIQKLTEIKVRTTSEDEASKFTIPNPFKDVASEHILALVDRVIESNLDKLMDEVMEKTR